MSEKNTKYQAKSKKAKRSKAPNAFKTPTTTASSSAPTELPELSNTAYKVCIETSVDQSTWQVAPATLLPSTSSEDIYLVEVEKSRHFRVKIENTGEVILGYKGFAEGRSFKEYNYFSVINPGSSDTVDGFKEDNKIKKFKFLETPLNEQAEQNLYLDEKIGVIQLEFQQLGQGNISETLPEKVTNKVEDLSAWKVALQVRLGVSIATAEEEECDVTTQYFERELLSKLKNIKMICRDKTGCAFEKKKRRMELSEEERQLLEKALGESSKSRRPTDESAPQAAKKKKIKHEPGVHPLKAWNYQQVADWITSLDPTFKDYGPMFLTNHMDGEALQGLNNDFLQQLGVVSVGHRIKILSKLQEQKAASATALTPTVSSSSAAASSSSSSAIVLE